MSRLEKERHNKMSELRKGSVTVCESLKKSCASNNEGDGKADRSHDGVFLRPGAVASSNSPPLNTRLSKRPSVDSGIGVEVNRQNVLRTSKYFKDFQKFSRSVY